MSEPGDVAPRETTIVLGYGPARKSLGWRRWTIRFVAAAVVAGMLLFAASFERGSTVLVCNQCAAIRQFRFVSCFGSRFRSHDIQAQGAVSKFIQRFEKNACLHQWTLCTESTTFSCALGRGGRILRWSDVPGQCPGLEHALNRRQQSNPAFAAALIHAVRNPDEEKSIELLSELWDEAIPGETTAMTAPAAGQ